MSAGVSIPHPHAIVTDGCFLPDGSFVGVPGFHAEDLEEAFQYEVFKMLKKEGKINDAIIENMLSWRHTGFHVHVGGRIWPEDETALGNLAKYIVRASFSQERMLCIPAEKSPDGSAKVVYKSKDGRTEQTFDAPRMARASRRSYSEQIRAARQIRRVLFQQVPRHAQKGGNRPNRAVDRARRNDVETVPPQMGDADSKNLRSRSSVLSQLSKSNADHIDPRGWPNRQKDPGAPRPVGCPQPRPAFRRRFAYLRTRLRRFGLSNPAIRLLGLNSRPLEKKRNFGIGAELRPEKGRFPCFQDIFDFPRTIFDPQTIFSHPLAALTISRPPAPSLRRNMLRRREGAGGRGAFEKPVVFFLTKSEFLSYFLDKKRVPIIRTRSAR